MEKPGQGNPHPEIIVDNQAKSRLRVAVESLLTVAFWMLYVYILLPIFTLVLWVFGVRTIYDEIFGLKGYLALIDLLKNGGLITIAILAILAGWAFYNYRMFMSRGERRSSRVSITNDREVARLMNVDLDALKGIRRLTRLRVKIDGEHYLVVRDGPEGMK
ncbi:MAG TPA: poly-beta-1,6-N-acetyl-D-glucosamine biosynthesis protein PgaD [Syntrophales bacterium]|nr:poly-beta-1,6-N-acetyl-D-glucosamine biosynthesis protein PgaD [Syntrophales bacterium]HQM28695.1 poly-beta-1,6-N-acetyl-D-glucosamine biosynthesis protein PgaD [Syntrophales bacterium]